MRRLRLAVGIGHHTRLDSIERIAAIGVEFGSARLSCGSAKRPCASACQISSIASGTGWPSPSSTRPSTLIRSPDVSGVTRLLVKASFQSYLPFDVSP